MRWYRRLIFRVYAWAKAIRGPEESPDAWAVSIMGMLLGLNCASIFLIYFRISGHGVRWLERTASALSLLAFPLSVAYIVYFLRRLPQIQAEFEDDDVPSIGGPGPAFAIYVLVTIALCITALVMMIPPAKGPRHG
jgi:hypothetical protein